MSPIRFVSFAFLLALTVFFLSAAQSAPGKETRSIAPEPPAISGGAVAPR